MDQSLKAAAAIVAIGIFILFIAARLDYRERHACAWNVDAAEPLARCGQTFGENR